MNIIATCSRQSWNKGKLVGQKTPLRLRDIWAIRVRLQIAERTRDLALFDLAIDSKLRACDLTKLRVRDVAHGEYVLSRAIVMQQKTQRPVQFEITEQTRSALTAWIHQTQLRNEDCLFPSRLHTSNHLSTRQYARIVKSWVKAVAVAQIWLLLILKPLEQVFEMGARPLPALMQLTSAEFEKRYFHSIESI